MTRMERTYHQNTFLGALSVKPRFSWSAVGVGALKELNIYIFDRKSMRGDNFTHIPAPRPFSDSHYFWHVGSNGGSNQPRQLLCKSVQELSPLRGSKFSLLHWLDVSPLQQCGTNILQCDDVELLSVIIRCSSSELSWHQFWTTVGLPA